MKMENLILVRHADFIAGGCLPNALSEIGVAKSKAIAEKLAFVLKGKSVAILSSYQDRAMQTAEIIGEQLGVAVIQCPPLYEEGGFDKISGEFFFDETIKVIKSYENSVEVLILVAHEPQVMYLPYSYFKKWRFKLGFQPLSIRKGCAISIDCITGGVAIYEPAYVI